MCPIHANPAHSIYKMIANMIHMITQSDDQQEEVSGLNDEPAC